VKHRPPSENDVGLHGNTRSHYINCDASGELQNSKTSQNRVSTANEALPQTAMCSGLPQLTPSSQALSVEPSLAARKLAIRASFSNYSSLNTLRDEDRRISLDFLFECCMADHMLQSIANIYREPRSPGFMRCLIEKVAENYLGCWKSIREAN
jgi:hypothetical protein